MQNLSVCVSWVKADWHMGAVEDHSDQAAAVVIDDVARRLLPWEHDAACAGGEWGCALTQVHKWLLWHAAIAAHPLVEATLSGARALPAGPVDWLWDVAREGTERFLHTLPACWDGEAEPWAGSDLAFVPLHDALTRAGLSLLVTPGPVDRQQRIVASILRSLSRTHGCGVPGGSGVEL